MTVFSEFVKWCSFCMKNIAGGELEIPEDNIDLPVCDECMDNFEEQVAPVLKGLMDHPHGTQL